TKANSAAQLDAVVVQDLTLGEGQAVENGDSLEVAYTGCLLQNHTIGPVRTSLRVECKVLLYLQLTLEAVPCNVCVGVCVCVCVLEWSTVCVCVLEWW